YDEARFDGGTDPITVGITVDMAAHTVTGDPTYVGTDHIYGVEGVRGSLLDDTYIATGFNSGNFTGPFRDGPLVNPEYNRFAGASGNDTIIGNGQTVLDYRSSSTPITVTFTGQGTGTATGPMDGTDTFSGVYGINDTPYDDVLTGSDASAPDYWEVFN